MPKIFLTDVDEVCLDWYSGLKQYLAKNYPQYEINLNEYSMGLPKDVAKKLIDEFNTSPDFENLLPLRDSVEYIKKIRNELDYKFAAITTCLATEISVGTESMRVRNLVNVFGNGIFQELHCLHIGESKLPILQKYEPTYWIDDKLKHCESGIIAGHKVFQMLHPYNENDERPENIIPVSSWQEIYQHLLANLN